MRHIYNYVCWVEKYLPLYLFTFLLFSCETDSYEKGEGEYSLMQADFCELPVDEQKWVNNFITDDGDNWQLTKAVTASWIETADTTYRAIIYYNKVADGQAEPIAMGPVVTLQPVEHWRLKEQPQDPIGFESGWVARNGKYLNIGLLMKTGRVDDDEQPHQVAVAQDTMIVHDNGQRTVYYRLLHSQNDAPQYYTNRRYVSILLPEQCPDTIRFQLKTYDGVVEKTYLPSR